MSGQQFRTLTVDASAGAVQAVAAEVLRRSVGVSQGTWTELTLAGDEAERVAAALRERGYTVELD